jgi:hypothetical protein
MNLLLMLLGIGLLLLPLVISIRRSTELFRLRVRGGRARFVRGRIPQSLLDDFSDVVSSPALEHAEIWAVRRDGKAELMTKGEVHPDQLQRLRNTLGTYSLQRIMAGGSKRHSR